MTGRAMAEVAGGLLFLSTAACGGRFEAAPAVAGHDAGSLSAGGDAGASPVAGAQAPVVDGGVPASPPPLMGGASPPPRTCPAAPPPGATWTEVPPPAGLPAGFVVTDAWSAGADEFFFVGQDPVDAIGNPSPIRRVLHWSQGCWTVELSIMDSFFALAQVSGTSPDDVWIAAGDAVYHRDAAGWSPDARLNALFAPPPGFESIIEDVQARTPDDVWFTAGSIVHLLNGQVTTTVIPAPATPDPNPITFAYQSIAILGENDVWIGGSAEQNSNTMPPAFLFHFDGRSWTVHGPVGSFTVAAIWPAGSPDALWLAVPSSADPLFPIEGFADDTRTLTTIANWEIGPDVGSFWGRAPDDIWAAGQDIAHFDGKGWSRVADVPDTVRQPQNIFDPGAVVVGDGQATWLTNAGPVFARKAAGAAP